MKIEKKSVGVMVYHLHCAILIHSIRDKGVTGPGNVCGLKGRECHGPSVCKP